MPTKRPQKTPTDYLATPPTGMWYEENAGRTEPFMARWRMTGGAKQSRAFTTARGRADFAGEWLIARKAKGTDAVMVSPRTVELLAEFARITGGADLLTVAHAWAKLHKTAHGMIMVDDACERYLAAQAEKKLARDTVTHRALHLSRLRRSVSNGAILADLTPEWLRTWLAGLLDPETGAIMSGITRNAHRASVNRLLEHAVAERWLDTNPMAAVPAPEAEDDETVNILTVEQTRHLFAVNAGALCVGRLALEAFGGLRFTSSARIAAADFDHESQGVTFPGPKHKTGKRHYVDGWPANLWPWVKHAPQACWELPPALYIHKKRAMMEAAGFKGGEVGREGEEEMRNVLRHSFATYHVAAHRDAAKTAHLLTHRNASMLYAHYKGRANQADGLAYFEIMPPAK